MESELEHLRSLLPHRDMTIQPVTRAPRETNVMPPTSTNRSMLNSTTSENPTFAMSPNYAREQTSADGSTLLPVPSPFEEIHSNPGNIIANSTSSLALSRQSSQSQAGRSGYGFGSHRSATKSFLPESQPKTSRGYEWNERQRVSPARADGTASLSIEPDGQGYLGEFGFRLVDWCHVADSDRS